MCRLNVNVTYTFDSFVAGETSRLAFSHAVAVAKQPGGAHNPLFLYGPTGCGKSHLLHAIAHARRAAALGDNMLLLSADTFAAQLIGAIRADRMPAFRQSIAAVDMLLLDDAPLGQDRPHTLEEIFFNVNQVVSGGAQVVVTFGMRPSDLGQHSRASLERATIAEIGYPDETTRLELVRREAERRGMMVPVDARHYLARRLTGSPRRIQSVMARIAAESTVAPQRVDLMYVKRLLARL
ncbi:MAG TPA: DnaA/Hda family protein [Thermoanaerobaculia bacterium]|nr:DnaA/Hda family protein [Thermoanaerobaculia bacterium]